MKTLRFALACALASMALSAPASAARYLYAYQDTLGRSASIIGSGFAANDIDSSNNPAGCTKRGTYCSLVFYGASPGEPFSFQIFGSGASNNEVYFAGDNAGRVPGTYNGTFAVGSANFLATLKVVELADSDVVYAFEDLAGNYATIVTAGFVRNSSFTFTPLLCGAVGYKCQTQSFFVQPNDSPAVTGTFDSSDELAAGRSLRFSDFNFGNVFGREGTFSGRSSYADSENFATNGVARLRVIGPLPTAAGDVPEPATWGMMILGFGLTGASMRRRRTAASPA